MNNDPFAIVVCAVCNGVLKQQYDPATKRKFWSHTQLYSESIRLHEPTPKVRDDDQS